MTLLKDVWSEISWYLSNGISLIPVRDQKQGNYEAKTPYGKSWKQYQTTIITKEDLWFQMDQQHNTTAIGILGGKVSGNLEIIDIDVKFLPGIDAILFKDIELLYPEIWNLLRIHKTPSGGYHLLYRCEAPVDGNQKLAGRPAYEDELSIRPKNKTYNFIETRGEGGYVVAPPAMNYSVLFKREIPILTKEQRASIINLCKSYTKIIKVERPPKPTVATNDYYETNPFEDYNNRVDPTSLMEELGWSYYKDNSQFIWYTRPGKISGVSMSFNLNKRFFYCFTASTELEESHGYTPAVLLSTILHGGDRKKTYSYLVSKGYGKIKPEREKQIAKRAAINAKQLPPNASPEALAFHVAISQQMQTDHPYGVYWYDDVEKGIIIDREALYAVADGLGFRLFNEEPVQILGNLVYKRDARYFFDAIKSYIHEEDADVYKSICNSYESFIERHGKFTISRLTILTPSDLMHDTKTHCYKFYQNGMLTITADGSTLSPIPQHALVWSTSIQQRNYLQTDTGLYVDFLHRAVGLNDYLLNVIGYLSHEFKDETAGYIVVLSEECPNPKDGGGSGKNIFAALLNHTTSTISKPGSQVKYDERFMQSWNFQKIMVVSDVPKNFDFGFLKELSTGTGIMKKLFVNEYVVDSANMPKFLISTNFSYEVKDGGIKRRIRPIEFTDFFTRNGGVDTFYQGKHFPNDWTEQDWGSFDSTIALGVQMWLANNRKLPAYLLTSGGWSKQFEQSYGSTCADFINENFDTWKNMEFISNDQFKTELETFYNENSIPKNYQPSTKRLYEAIREFCEKNKVEFTNGVNKRVGPLVVKGKEFTPSM